MKIVFVLICFLTTEFLGAQQYGVQWVIGDSESVLDFRNDTLLNYHIGPLMPMFLTEANICDSLGNLLYYTNGIYIAGSNGNQIANGDSLNPCNFTNQWACCGLDIPQAALFLPEPGSQRYFYLIHFSFDTVGDTRPGTLYYSLIDVEGNNDSGEVIAKNIPFFKGTIFRGGGMTACKHGNGRDWWIVMGDLSNTYYKFLLTPNGINNPLIQTIGPSYDNVLNIAYSKFSLDGSKYVTGCYQGPILSMDFDRCTGEFSNPISIYNQDSDAAAVEFSPNGQFIYATNTINLTQFDLSLPNPQHDSITLYQAINNDEAQMYFLQIAPNGKLYASCFNGGFYFIHVVNYPDLKGDSSNYMDTGYTTLTANSANFPNMINYRLGALQGSACDTLTAINKLQLSGENTLRVMPNPADKYAYVEMGMQGSYEFDLLNAVGQVIDKKETRQVDIFDAENLASGIYLLKVIDITNATQILTRKVIVQH